MTIKRHYPAIGVISLKFYRLIWTHELSNWPFGLTGPYISPGRIRLRI